MNDAITPDQALPSYDGEEMLYLIDEVLHTPTTAANYLRAIGLTADELYDYLFKLAGELCDSCR